MSKDTQAAAPRCPDCGIILFFGPSHNCRPRTSHQQPSEKRVATPKPKSLPTKATRQRSAEIVGAARVKDPAARKIALETVIEKLKKLTPHPDCPVCNARREKTKDLMRKRRAKR